MLKGIFKRLAIKRLAEEALYERAFEELRVGLRREGLWAKAIANSDGDESKAQGLYLKYRVQSMIDDGNIAEAYLGEINFSDKNKNESVMHFKGSNEAFQYACRFTECDLSRGSFLLAMVSEVRDADSEKPLIVLKVSSDDGGFFVRQKFPKKSIPEVSEGDLVIWRAIASGDRTLLDRSTWAGSIEYKVAPVYDIHLGWKRL